MTSPPRKTTPSPAGAANVQQLCDGVVNRTLKLDRAARNGSLSLLEWGRYYLADHFRLPPSAMHQWAGRLLDDMQTRRGVRVNLLGPRGSAKSTLCTLCYVLRRLVEQGEPYVWIVCETSDQAQTHLENLRLELESNILLARDFPTAAGPGPRWRTKMLELPNGCVVESFGAGQSIRGRRRREHRPTLIVCDDVQGDSHMTSRFQREASRRWFCGTLLKAGTRKTNVVNVATALHRDALAMQLHAAPGWMSAVFRAIQQWPQNMNLWHEWEQIYCDVENADAGQHAREFFDKHQQAMTEAAEALWPEHEDLYCLMRMRAEGGHAAFEREKQNSPVDPDRCEWPEEYFGDHIWFDRWPRDLKLRTMALDPSKGTDSRHGDYSAFVMLGVDADGRLLIDADLAKRPTPQIVADGVTLCEQFRPDVFGVETNQFQELLAAEFVTEIQRRRQTLVQPVAIHNHVHKATRIRRLGPFLSQRRLRFKARSPSARLLVEQLRDFPLAEHDDGPDALEMAVRLAEDWFGSRNDDDGLGSRLPVG